LTAWDRSTWTIVHGERSPVGRHYRREETVKSCAFAVLLLCIGTLPAAAQDSLNVYHGEIPEGDNTFFVAPDGDDLNAGTEEEPFATLDHAVSQVQRGDVIVMRGGVYEHDDIIRIQTPSGFTDDYIVLTAYPGEVPILDFSSQPKERDYHGIRLNANWWHLIGITIRNASHNGIRMDGSYNILEQLTAYGNHDTGIHMAGGASYNLIKNSDSFNNFNFDTNRTPRIGNNADGFSAKFDIGPGNRYVGCRSWENSDDGFDFWEAESTIIVDSSWAFGNGDASVFGNPDDFEGNGNGFKLGGNFVVADHVVTRSMAFDNFGESGNAKGFDYNNNSGAMTLVHNTAYNNGRNYFFPLDAPAGQAVFLNNLSAVASLHATTPPGAVLAGNSWQLGSEITVDMFESVDTGLAKEPRQMDGSLPNVGLLKPNGGSVPVDAGVLAAATFYGAAPDIGVFEYADGDPVEPWIQRGPGSVIVDLKVYDIANAEDWTLITELNPGAEAFGDTSITVSSIPVELDVDEWIQTASDSRTLNYLFPAAELSTVAAGHVFVAHSDDIGSKPEWLDSFVETPHSLVLDTDEGPHGMTIYEKGVAAGEVISLGRNSRDGSAEAPMYVVMFGNEPVVATEDDSIPDANHVLHEVYPNPVDGSATISFTLVRAADVSLRIYDAIGREVATVAAGHRVAGAHTVQWSVDELAAGVYYCRMTADGFSDVVKLLRVR
jgi:hypothetical protein